MASLNRVELIGNLGKDPEMRYMANGEAVCNFSIATSESWKDKATGEKKEKTEWHTIVIYRKLAEIAGEYLKKGSKVFVAGKLQTRKWQDKDGNDRYTTEILVSDMIMLSGSDSSGSGGQRSESRPAPPAPPAARPAQPAPPADQQDFDDDIPF